MRPSIKLLVALNFSLAATSAACDGVAADDVAAGPDDPVSFRDDCVPPNCGTNSPYVGDYPFSNIRIHTGDTVRQPFVDSNDYAYWGSGYLQLADTWMPFEYLAPTPEGRLLAYTSDDADPVPVDEGLQAFFALTIVDTDASPPAPHTVPIWIKDVSSSQPRTDFSTWKYTIAAGTSPPTSEFLPVLGLSSFPPAISPTFWLRQYYSICPFSEEDEEDGTTLVLPRVELNIDGEAAWLTNGGNGEPDPKVPSTSVFACQGQAFSKPLELLAVTPNWNNTPRSYGLDGYNALANAYRAFYAGAPRTELGTPVSFKDLGHDPPMFDQTTSAYLPSPPLVGDYRFVLESVYQYHNAFGANCYYTDSDFPNGAHRFFDPPGGNPELPGWSNMLSCGTNPSTWGNLGPVGAFVLKLVVPSGGGSS